MPIDVVLFLVVLALILAVGVPAIRLGIWVPRRLELAIVRDDQMTDEQRRHFQRLDDALSGSGYTPRFSFAVTNMQGATLSRVYLSDHESAVLSAHCLRSASVIDENAISGQNYLEWTTEFHNGTTLMTRNVELTSPFERMPHQIIDDWVGQSDPVALRARHVTRAAGLLDRQPRHPHGRDLLAELRDFHQRWCAFQESRGLLVPAAGDRCNASVRAALRGVAAYLNPLADNFTLGRFAAAAISGVGLPLLVTWWIDPGVPWRPAGFPLLLVALPFARLPVLVAAYAAGGAAVGYLFTGKAFIWAALLGYSVLRLTGVGGAELLLAPWMGFVAERVGAYRSRRNALV